MVYGTGWSADDAPLWRHGDNGGASGGVMADADMESNMSSSSSEMTRRRVDAPAAAVMVVLLSVVMLVVTADGRELPQGAVWQTSKG